MTGAVTTFEQVNVFLPWRLRYPEAGDAMRGAVPSIAAEQVEEIRREERPSILYFARPDCPWCVMEENELRGLTVSRVPEGSPLWEEHGVRVTPTLLVGGRRFEGFTRRSEILRGLGRE